jgi:hypothetical protein
VVWCRRLSPAPPFPPHDLTPSQPRTHRARAERKASNGVGGASESAAVSSSSSPAVAPAGCEAERAAYEGQCLRSWVKYWDDRVKRGIPLRGGGPGS